MTFLTRFSLVLLIAGATACSSTPPNPLGPTGTDGNATNAAVADGTPTLKVTAPNGPQPASGTVLEGITAPVLSVGNGGAKFAGNVPLQTRFQLEDGTGVIAEPLVAAGGDGRSTWQVEGALQWETTYRWRARTEHAGTYGPWSEVSEFRTPSEPVVVRVGFTLPPACGARPDPTSNRIDCVLAVAAASPNWGACAGGSGVACHRFTRDVAAALAAGDPAWGLVGKNPGEQQCTLDRCGSLGGEGFGEDVIAYLAGPDIFRQWLGFDIITGAGAPGASAGYSGPLGRRPGNYWAPVPR